jgi:DNA processing protein
VADAHDDERPRRHALALSLAPRVGGARHRELVDRFGSAGAALDQAFSRATREQALADADRTLMDARRCGAAVWVVGDHAYPRPLLDLPDAPPHLFALGTSDRVAQPVVAIVGTRDATAYGERVTREIAAALARAGACVVSGMARGIDAAAHEAALAAGGRTVAVLGTGIDVPYPAAHRALHRRIAAEGVVLSEHPPGAPASPGSFPRRNRIIAALASATIVVEAGHRSGALITATHALDLGRTVAAVPGPIDSAQSAGSNELLRDGAMVIAAVADALALLGLAAPVRDRAAELTGGERRVWDALADGALDLDAIAVRTALPVRHCLTAVTSLELAGAVECALTGEIRRR